jgi:hypothetical protein
MLKVSSANMDKMGKARVSRGGRSTPTDRGGIRKKGGAVRIDRDGDLDMSTSADRGRGGNRGRGEPSRAMPSASGRRPGFDHNRTLNTIQKALSSNATSHANVRQASGRGPRLEQVSVRGWKQSKAASNPDGGVGSLITFLEKKIATPDAKSRQQPFHNITKVCAMSAFTVTVEYFRHRLRRVCSLVLRQSFISDERFFPLPRPCTIEPASGRPTT